MTDNAAPAQADAAPAVAAKAKDDSDDWHITITACAYATMPNGGKVTMEGTPGHTFEEAVTHLEQTHELYIQWSGWGGGNVIAFFLMATNLLC